MKHLVVISDLHCGSTLGLLPPGFVTHEGQEVVANAAQAYLWDCWLAFWAKANAITGGRYSLLVNGDLVEGCHHKSTQVISPDPGDHMAAAIQALRPAAAGAEAVYVVEGTECHTGGMEHAIARELAATRDPATGRHAWPRLELKLARAHLVASHHMPTTKRPYLEASGLGLELNTERLEAMRGGHAVPSVVIRSHRHKYGAFSDESGLLVATPPWQLLTRFGHKVVPAASCHIGGVILTFDGDCLPSVCPIIFRPKERQHVER